MNTTAKLAPLIGKTGKMLVSPSTSSPLGWPIPVRVIDARAVWNSDQFRVTYIDDNGNQRGPAVWVDAARVTLDPEQRP